MVSQIVAALLAPSSFLVLLLVAALFAGFLGHRRTARLVASLAVTGLIAIGFGPGAGILARPLEDRFPLPSQISAPPTGIIVLSGALNPAVSRARHSFRLNNNGSRMTTATQLARVYPEARLIFTGTSLYSNNPEENESIIAKEFFAGLGVEASRITLEGKARNTFENAVFTRDLIQPKPGDIWLLVTSAAHMPRAVGAFREAGFSVIPYPTAYLTRGNASDFRLRSDLSDALEEADSAVHEWIGLITYWLAGRTDALFPGPDQENRTALLRARSLPRQGMAIERRQEAAKPRRIMASARSELGLSD